MRTTTSLALFLGLLALGCGGSTSGDSNSGGSSGSGASSGSGGASSGGSSAGGASTGGASTGGASTGGYGGTATGGSSGVGGNTGMCCTYDYDCPQYGAEGFGVTCVNNVCKSNPGPGLCWSDKDCGGVPGACQGASVCPCGADCFAADSPGKCVVGEQCCSSSNECVSTPESSAECVAGNCEPTPPPGQCWTDADCGPASTCSGACICPCGAVCACGGQMGSCSFKPD